MPHDASYDGFEDRTNFTHHNRANDHTATAKLSAHLKANSRYYLSQECSDRNRQSGDDPMMRATSRLEIESTAVYAVNSTWQHNTPVWSANGSGTQGGRVHESLPGTRALDSPARLFDFSFSSVKTM